MNKKYTAILFSDLESPDGPEVQFLGDVDSVEEAKGILTNEFLEDGIHLIRLLTVAESFTLKVETNITLEKQSS